MFYLKHTEQVNGQINFTRISCDVVISDIKVFALHSR